MLEINAPLLFSKRTFTGEMVSLMAVVVVVGGGTGGKERAEERLVSAQRDLNSLGCVCVCRGGRLRATCSCCSLNISGRGALRMSSAS